MSNQLFFLSLADIFSVYPTIFKELVSTRPKQTLIYLPSDADWQEKMYYRLLEVQKRVNEAINSGEEIDETIVRKDTRSFNHLDSVKKISPSVSPSGGHSISRSRCHKIRVKLPTNIKTFWNLEHIAKAAQLLSKPPKTVEFANEHEMRKVYSLIYDVFRFKVILSNALDDTGFYKHFPKHTQDENRVWLLLFDLLEREFKQRYAEEIDLQLELFQKAGVEEIATHLWTLRKPLAAAVSRMRIKYGALSLMKLLPIHLQNQKVAVAASNPVVTGWINPFLLRDKEAADKYLQDLGFIAQLEEDKAALESKQYRWDNICPLFMYCVPEDKGEFTKSKLVTKHYFVMQDKAFSYGPAIMSRLLDYFELSGDILQTHISSPRSTAFLAALFYSVNRVNNFYVYGAGTNLKEYRKFMEVLGITNIRIFGELFTSFPLESKRFATVVGIFANPPNSFSAISDPIDLICSRGGDLSMLEVLTESEISDEGKHRVSLILDEQLLTLQMAMSRPQIQFLLYQTHSIVTVENQDMVKYAVKLINETSLHKHKVAYREKKRLEALAELEAANIPSAALSSPRKRGATEDKAKQQQAIDGTTVGSTANDDTEDNVALPDNDEFICEELPDICINQDNCLNLRAAGCFLAMIRRRKITQLNAKYLIKMAEARGLFGNTDKSGSKGKGLKSQDPHAESAALMNYYDDEQERHVNVSELITRLLRETNASINRIAVSKISYKANQPLKFNFKHKECVRYRASLLRISSSSLHQMRSLWYCSYECLQEACHNANCRLRRPVLIKLAYPIHIKNVKF